MGAECTGKTSLQHALLHSGVLQAERTQLVGEYLRQWCDTHQRLPRGPEQTHIALTQQERIQHALRTHHVVTDTTALMTAIYSDVILGDDSLYPLALAWQRAMPVTLVLATDLPWQADGIQRDGREMQQRIDRRLREVLAQAGIPFSVVRGQGLERTTQAVLAIRRALEPVQNASPALDLWHRCENCSHPEGERALFRALLAPTA
nr:ATP-binding protein [Curvibacter sp. CHRR-16]